ncbi:MAG TPA: hypothetical protein VG323_15805 [Thermoanaerobaculia bacterium]|nr:hypothetical protein [Thermoanaerobaculia bacterium]
MRNARALIVFLLLVGSSAVGADLGRAVGAVTIDGKPIVLQYAYAVDHQKNQLTNKNSDTRIILTDKPLPDGTKLDDVDYNFPDGILGVVVCVSSPSDNVSHVVVQHPTGTYDGGYFEGVQDYKFKRVRGDRGTIGGTLQSKKVTTNTMSFFFDAEFAASVK